MKGLTVHKIQPPLQAKDGRLEAGPRSILGYVERKFRTEAICDYVNRSAMHDL